MSAQPVQHRFDRSLRAKGVEVIDCLECGFWHVFPLPSAEELRRYYEANYFETLGDNRSMTDKLHDPDGFYTLQYEDKFRRLERLLPPALPRTLIDVGSGYGDFLRFMRGRGWRVQGLEASQSAVALCREQGLGATCASVDDLASFALPPSAVVTLNSVLEHLADPWSVLEVVRDRLLLSGGVLNIHVPNDFNPLQRVLAQTVLQDSPEAQYWIAIPDHVNYWNHGSLRRFLERLGFRVLLLTSTFPLELFPLMGDDYVSDPTVGRHIHLKRVRFERLLREAGAHELKDELYGALAMIGLGREIEAFATPAVTP